MRTLHIITRLIVGGAQENTVATCEDQTQLHNDEVLLAFGPETGPEGSLHERAAAGGYDVRVLPELRRALAPRSDVVAVRRLRELIREFRPAVVHTHSSKAGIVGRAAAWRERVPCVHTVHGASFHYGQRQLLQRGYIAAERWAARRCQRMVSVCDAMTDAYVEAGVAPREKFTTVYSGFDVEPFLTPSRSRDDIRSELGFQPDDFVVATVARLFPLKGHETLLDVAPRLAEDPRLRFLWVGDGVLRATYEARIHELGLADRFVFTGLVRPNEVPQYMHAADVLCHPSQWEGLARVLPQALISQRPVVSYDVGGAREVVVDDETGFVVDRNDSAAMAAALERLASDAALRKTLGENGRTQFTDLFRHETMTRRLREEYARAIAEFRRQAAKKVATPQRAI